MEIVVQIEADGAVGDATVAGFAAEAARQRVRNITGRPDESVRITLAYAVIDGDVSVPTFPQRVVAPAVPAEVDAEPEPAPEPKAAKPRAKAKRKPKA